MTNRPNEYTCAGCHQTFPFGWSEEEEQAEAEQLWGANYRNKKTVRVCDSCFRKMMAQNAIEN